MILIHQFSIDKLFCERVFISQFCLFENFSLQIASMKCQQKDRISSGAMWTRMSQFWRMNPLCWSAPWGTRETRLWVFTIYTFEASQISFRIFPFSSVYHEPKIQIQIYERKKKGKQKKMKFTNIIHVQSCRNLCQDNLRSQSEIRNARPSLKFIT